MSSIVYLLTEQIVTSSYHIEILELIVGLSLIPSVLILISLAFTTLKSFLSTKRKIVMINGIAIIAIALQLFIAFCYIEINLYSKPEIITPDRNPWASYSIQIYKVKCPLFIKSAKLYHLLSFGYL
jgi:hypothetical protein